MINKENPIVSYSRGILHSAISLNLLQGKIKGKRGIGEELINKYTMPNIGSAPNSYFFLSGALTELALEIATPIYLACSSDSIKWYHPLFAHAIIKLVPRGLERILKKF